VEEAVEAVEGQISELAGLLLVGLVNRFAARVAALCAGGYFIYLAASIAFVRAS
jgi:hypothetical protein